MKTSWFIGLLMLFMLMSLVSGIIELQYLGGSQDSEAIMERLFSSPALSWDILFALWDALWFNYAFFTGAWQIVRWVLFMPISAAIAINLMILLINALSNIVSSVGRLLRPGA
jgi:hypothetical protein